MTDPDAIAALLNQPGGSALEAWTIYTTDPDVALLEALLAWQVGPPFTAARRPDLAQILVVDPATGTGTPLFTRLDELRAGPRGTVPHVAAPLDDDDPPRRH